MASPLLEQCESAERIELHKPRSGMKSICSNCRPRLSWVIAAILSASFAPGSAAVFTSGTTISPINTNYDGLDLVVSNCTVTIDGPHSLASLKLGAGGV